MKKRRTKERDKKEKKTKKENVEDSEKIYDSPERKAI